MRFQKLIKDIQNEREDNKIRIKAEIEKLNQL